MIPPILQVVCGETAKYDSLRPYVTDRWLWATDGHILIRVSKDDADRAVWEPWDDRRKAPSFLTVTCAPGPHEIALPEAQRFLICPACEGHKVITTGRIECEECGEIVRLTHQGRPVVYDCLQCGGQGQVQNWTRIRISEQPETWLSGYYIGLLREHGITSVLVHDAEPKPVYFAGIGFSGWLMPMVREAAR